MYLWWVIYLCSALVTLKSLKNEKPNTCKKFRKTWFFPAMMSIVQWVHRSNTEDDTLDEYSSRTLLFLPRRQKPSQPKKMIKCIWTLQLCMLHTAQHTDTFLRSHGPALSLTLRYQWLSGFKTKAVARTDSNCNLIHNWNLASWTPIIQHEKIAPSS